ncbi:MAG: heat-inducible transcription repressor HrcA [Eubacteriaceae bacterium]|jgi:heat-inducible transcriptional repressor|nr:heat-inducible transcription repressor HrcA [Eubacteriaceae bacterium]
MELNERKERILEVIIRSYIDTAEPVGSRTVAKQFKQSISAATIRNEMSDLEDMGFLVQPHTSAGRIPTQKAYRYYVDSIMKVKQLEEVLKRDIHEGYLKVAGDLEDIMTYTTNLLSDLTKYASVVLSPKVTWANCKHLQIIPVFKERVLVVVVTTEGFVENIELNLSKELTIQDSLRLSNIINSLLGGLHASEINHNLIDELANVTLEEKVLLREIVIGVQEALFEHHSQVMSTGVTNLLDYPEFADTDRVRHLVKVSQKKNILAEALIGDHYSEVLRITIGDENKGEELKELSLITTTYELQDNIIGAIGVIGPTRMQYDHVSSMLEYIRHEINQNLLKILLD